MNNIQQNSSIIMSIYILGHLLSFAVFCSKISIFYKISMTSFDRTKFQLSESVLQITVWWFLMEL